METVLLSLLVHSLPPWSSRDMPIYLPYGSPKVCLCLFTTVIVVIWEKKIVSLHMCKTDLPHYQTSPSSPIIFVPMCVSDMKIPEFKGFECCLFNGNLWAKYPLKLLPARPMHHKGDSILITYHIANLQVQSLSDISISYIAKPFVFYLAWFLH